MSAMKVEINDIHINEAEHIFIKGNEFDKKERIPFIKNLETCDLLAVPGSGKTTALMAKLYCLAYCCCSKELVLSYLRNRAISAWLFL